jgi:hypothetical protein
VFDVLAHLISHRERGAPIGHLRKETPHLCQGMIPLSRIVQGGPEFCSRWVNVCLE